MMMMMRKKRFSRQAVPVDPGRQSCLAPERDVYERRKFAKLLPHAADEDVLMHIHLTQTRGFLSQILQAGKAEPLHNAAAVASPHCGFLGSAGLEGGAGASFGGGGTSNYQPER